MRKGSARQRWGGLQQCNQEGGATPKTGLANSCRQGAGWRGEECSLRPAEVATYQGVSRQHLQEGDKVVSISQVLVEVIHVALRLWSQRVPSGLAKVGKGPNRTGPPPSLGTPCKSPQLNAGEGRSQPLPPVTQSGPEASAGSGQLPERGLEKPLPMAGGDWGLAWHKAVAGQRGGVRRGKWRGGCWPSWNPRPAPPTSARQCWCQRGAESAEKERQAH